MLEVICLRFFKLSYKACSISFNTAKLLSYFHWLNPLERWVPLLVPEAKNSEKNEMTYFSPEMAYMR